MYIVELLVYVFVEPKNPNSYMEATFLFTTVLSTPLTKIVIKKGRL